MKSHRKAVIFVRVPANFPQGFQRIRYPSRVIQQEPFTGENSTFAQGGRHHFSLSMIEATTRDVLLGTAASVALLHTLIGVDHYLPFVVLGRARKWSMGKVAGLTALCGVGHVLGSAIAASGLANQFLRISSRCTRARLSA